MRRMNVRALPGIVVAIVSSVLVACAPQRPLPEPASPTKHADRAIKSQYRASVTYTEFGVPHVTANNWTGLGYGYGYATAEDNLCVLAEAFLTFRGERSRYFGAKATVQRPSTVGNPPNLDSDFFFRHVLSDAAIAKYRAAQPAEIEELTSGYAAGYSRYVREIRAGAQPGRHADCRNTEWVRGVTASDLYRRMYALVLGSSSVRFITPIANAAPPGTATSSVQRIGAESLASTWPVENAGDLGSNMIGFGSEATASKHGLLFGNPHWFWDGVDRFHQVHLKIPGQIDVEGASILGVPIVLIGFNKDIAWSHTVSTASRFTLYRLKLASGRPTDYVYDGKARHMQPTRITVEVRFEDGTIGPVTRTLYDSHFGPVLADGWTKNEAITIRDANLGNVRAYRNWLRWNRAASLDEFMSIQKEEVAIPWVNTIAVGRNDGRVWYADVGAIPNVSDAKRAACKVGDKALDGSRSQCEWKNDANAPQPGIFPASELPQLVRQDYAANMNDSYWLSNAKAPLPAFPSIIGAVNNEQSLRTRMGHILVRQRLQGEDGLEGTLATSQNVRDIVLNSRSLSAELLLDDVLANVCPLKTIPLSEDPPLAVDIVEACAVLTSWDRRGNLDSIGAQLWDKIWEALVAVPAAERYKVPFDPAAPLDTPRGLNTDNPKVVQAVAAGVDALSDTAVPADAARREYQYFVDSAGAHIPVAGGCGNAGYFTIVCASLTKKGVSLGQHGNSYMQVVTFTDDGVEPYTLFLPSQSTDPASPHYRDYTRAYSQKSWARAAFTDDEVKAGKVSELVLEE